MKPRLIPFEASHLEKLVGRSRYDIMDDSRVRGIAYTCLAGDEIVGCSGLIPMWPGVAHAWAVFGHLMPEYRMFVTRMTRAVLRDAIRAMSLHRIEAVVHEQENRAWIEMLGFELECISREYTSDRSDAFRYVFLVDAPRIVKVGSDEKPKFAACVSGRVIGGAAHAYTPDNVAYGITLWVNEAYRKRGIGLMLHQARIREAKRHGATHFVGISEDPGMIRILEKCGARKCVNELGTTYVCGLSGWD